MRQARWLAPWKDSLEKPAIYHCISRVVDRRFVFGEEEREQFRIFMRMQENFTGCRVLSYCVMSNHFHLLLEVPPLPEGGFSDTQLLERLSFLYSDAYVAEVRGVLEEVAKDELSSPEQRASLRAEIHERFTYRMHDLSQYMKTLLQRFTRWFNRTHSRCGTLWEQRYKSVIVESGTAARMMAAYIDLNPVRAGMVADPADYRWSSYGEAVGGGRKGNGKKARSGLARAVLYGDRSLGEKLGETLGNEATYWKKAHELYRELMGFALVRKNGKSTKGNKGEVGREQIDAADTREKRKLPRLPELGMGELLMKRVRYFTDGAVIGSKGFVNEVFGRSRERFPDGRKDGARPLRGDAKVAAGLIWSLRDLRG